MEGDRRAQWAGAAREDRWAVEATRWHQTAGAQDDLGEDGYANRNPLSEENQTFRIINSSDTAKWVMQIIFMEDAFCDVTL